MNLVAFARVSIYIKLSDCSLCLAQLLCLGLFTPE